MRWLVTVVVIAIIAFVGYRYFYTDEGQQVAEQAEQATDQVEETTEEDAEEATAAVEGATDQAADTAEQDAEEATESTEQAADATTAAVEGEADQAADTAERDAGEAAESTEQAADATAGAVEGEAEQAADTAEEATEGAEQTSAALTADGVDLGEEVGTTVSDATSALEGITDEASAEAALPSLQAVESKLDELRGSVEQLSQQGKEALASLLDDSLPELQELVTRVEGIEGVGEVVKPTLDDIMAKLDAWAEQPA